MTNLALFIILVVGISVFIYLDNKKIIRESKSAVEDSLETMREEPYEEIDDTKAAAALWTKEVAKVTGMRLANELMQKRHDAPDNAEEIKKLETRYEECRDRCISELAQIDDGILYGLAAQYIIAMLIRADELAEAKRIFSTVTHGLPRSVIIEEHGTYLENSQ